MVTRVSICICTFKRPMLLRNLLTRLFSQRSEGRFSYDIVIVDNDFAGSAGPVVRSVGSAFSVPIRYLVEPEQNIALARNKALEAASGQFVAFIDDDEVPESDWLITLLGAIKSFGADGVLGPVKPDFQGAPPRWVLRGRFFERPSHETGHVLDWWECYTGNVLFKRCIIEDLDPPFRKELGSGGEDRDFFRRLIAKGRLFVWCESAVVHETITPFRWKRRVMIQRALLRGKMAVRQRDRLAWSLAKSALATLCYSSALPFAALLGQACFMKCLVKNCDHVGKLLAAFGIDVIKARYITE